MQLTRIDRWLREKYVYETHIHTLRPVESVPKDVRVVEIPDIPGKRYKHLFIANTSAGADTLIAHLKENSQMYTTQIVDRDEWFVPFLVPKDKSVTWGIVFITLASIAAFFVLLYLKSLVLNPTFQESFKDALKLLKG